MKRRRGAVNNRWRERWKRKGREYVYQAKMPDEVSFVRDKVVLPSGKEFDYVSVDCPYEVVIVVGVDSRRRVLMIRQYRYLVDRRVWEVPSGSPSPGESLEAGAQREFEEEAGYRVGRLVKLGSYFSSVGLSNQLCHVYLGLDLQKSAQRLEEAEAIRAQWLPLDKAAKLVLQGQVMNVGAAYGVLLAACWLRCRDKREKTRGGAREDR